MNNGIHNVGVISLGCAKNKVDCEIMLNILTEHGYSLCNSYEDCDAVIINTCAFIQDAKEEALENIFQAAEYKKGKLKRLIVTGCLAQRYGNEICKLIPEVDAIVEVKAFDRIIKALESTESGIILSEPLTSPHPEGKRLLIDDSYSVYLKIAEGCSNRCSYCAIPYIRGPFMPRSVENITEEAKELAKDGAVEINLIAQDLTRHPQICEIIRNIAAIETVKWIRLLYLYPDEISDELINLMASEPKICKYIDLPLQHSATSLLKRMNRRGSGTEYTKLLKKIRKSIPNIALRTTFIVGFPGETKKDFENLMAFNEKIRFDNMGAFTYSPEEGTPAAKYVGQISKKTKARRLDKLMALQYGIALDKAEKHVGKTYEVLCEGYNEDGLYKGRTEFQAPEVDGNVFFTSEKEIKPGEFCFVTIESYENYDLYGSAKE